MEHQKIRITKRQFRIGDLAKELHVKKYVIRFWEKEFDLPSDRSEGGQRFYTEEDLATFQKIKDLLYAQGFTINGAKKQLRVTRISENIIVAEKHTHTITQDNTNPITIDEKPALTTHDEVDQVGAATTLITNPHTEKLLKSMSSFRQDLERFKELLERL